MARKKKVDVKPYPAAEDNPEMAAKLDSIGLPEQETKQKRHRRTRAEIDAEKNILDDSGYEVFRDFIKMLSDNDARRYGLEKMPKEEFEGLARQYSSIINYFLPKGKPIYFVCVTAAWQSFTMLRTRKEMIDEALTKREPEKPKSGVSDKPVDSGTRLGFPTDTSQQKVI